MSPWWQRPTSEGSDAPAESNNPSNYEPASLSQHTEELDSTSEPAPPPADRYDALSSAAEPRRYFEDEEAEPSYPRDGDDEAPEGDREHDGDHELSADADAEGEGDGEGEDAEDAIGNVEPGAEPGTGPERRRRRRGGRRRRGRNGNGNGHAAAAENESVAASPVLATVEPLERPRRDPRERDPRDRDRERERDRDRWDAPSVQPSSDLERLAREIVVSMPERASAQTADERKIALFCDLENVALGVRDSDVKKFDIDLVLERLLEKGKIIVKKAYADWERYSDYKRAFHEAAIEMIDIPQKYYSGKNSADIKMVVDAMDLSYAKEHLDTFVLLSGDSDFSPLVSKLKENNKYVIGIGVKNSSSNLLVDNCDEFIYYEDVWRDRERTPVVEGASKKQTEAFGLMGDAIQALMRENKDVLWGSMIKQTMKRKKPSFNESYYGYSTFSELLQDAERRGLVKLRKDQRSGGLIVTGFAGGR